MMYDPFQANIEEKEVEKGIASIADVMIHWHVSENNRGTRGTDDARLDQVLASLKNDRRAPNR
jgi:D-psicose/D-tagatose/L-ribulose 3-epimerase